MEKIFLTGKIGIGKSTVIKKVLDLLSLNYGGFMTLPIIDGSALKGFKIRDIKTSLEEEVGIFDENFIIHPQIDGFEQIGVKSLESALESDELIIMDELGFLEKNASKFKETVFKVLKSNKLVLGVIKFERNDFLNELARLVEIVEVTEANRNELPDKIRRMLDWTL
jgi:nucleoside-triphosphatase